MRASAGLGGGGGSLERTRLARRQANTRRIRESRISPQNILLQKLRSTRRRRRDGWKMPSNRISSIKRLALPVRRGPHESRHPTCPGFQDFRSTAAAVAALGVVGQRPDRAKGMIGRHALFRREVAEHVAGLLVVSGALRGFLEKCWEHGSTSGSIWRSRFAEFFSSLLGGMASSK